MTAIGNEWETGKNMKIWIIFCVYTIYKTATVQKKRCTAQNIKTQIKLPLLQSSVPYDPYNYKDHF